MLLKTRKGRKPRKTLGNEFKNGDPFLSVAFRIIERYEPIKSKDVWHRLAKKYGLLGGIAGIPHQEVQDILSELENQKAVVQKREKWIIRREDAIGEEPFASQNA